MKSLILLPSLELRGAGCARERQLLQGTRFQNRNVVSTRDC